LPADQLIASNSGANYPEYQRVITFRKYQGSLEKYQKVLRSNHYPWKQVLDTGGVKTSSIHIDTFPTSFLVDKNGVIIGQYTGLGDYSKLEKKLAEIMILPQPPKN
jgi:hypothetical protein